MHFQNCKYSFQLKGNRRKMGRKQVGFSNNFSNEFQRGRNRTRRVWSSTPLLVEYGYVWVVPWRLCSRLPWRGNRPYLQTGKQSLLAAQGHLFVAHTSLMWTSTSPSAFCSKICSCSIQYTKRNTHQEKKITEERILRVYEMGRDSLVVLECTIQDTKFYPVWLMQFALQGPAE